METVEERADRARRRSRAVVAAVVLSGAAGLVYQVAWTRRLASVTSVTVTAQAVVLAVFMAGLGIGALLAGRRAAGARRPLRCYALVEGAALLLALASMPLVTESQALRTLWERAVALPPSGLTVQLALVAGYLTLPAVAMGASLPFVIEWSDRRGLDADRSARWISSLYGLNTLGAALGCWLAGFVTVESLGLTRTVWVGAAGTTAAVLLALVADGRPGRAPAATREPVRAAGERRAGRHEARGAGGRVAWGWILVAAAGGFLGLAAEVVWTRLLSLIVLNTVYAFTQVLAWTLIGIAAGAGLAAAWIRTCHREADPAAALGRAAGLALGLAALVLACMPLVLVRVAHEPWLETALSAGFSLPGNLLLSALLVPPSALVAALLPLVVARVRLACGGAQGFSALYAANTGGSVAGSLAAGFLLLPSLGSAGALATLVAAALVLSAALLVSSPGPSWSSEPHALGRFGPWSLAALGSALLLSTVDLPRDVYRARIPEGTRILDFREGRHSDVMVTENERGIRRLWINSAWVAGTGGGHRSLGHLPALRVDSPRRMLGIALGTGQTFASAFAHGAESFDCVELDEGVIELSRRWFGEANGGFFERPGVRLHHDDGRAFLRRTDRRFDVIVLEPLQAWSVGTSNLYSRQFYEEAERALAPGGLLAQWIPFYGQGVRETKAMVRTARSVFPHATLWLDDHDGILLLGREPRSLSPEVLETRIRERGLVRDLARNGLAAMPDLLSLFVMGDEALDAWVGDAPILEDDRPFLEFAAARELGRRHYPEILESAIGALGEIEGRLAPDADAEARAQAARAERIRAARLGADAARGAPWAERAAILEAGLEEVPSSKTLLRDYRKLILERATALEAAGRAGDAALVYRRALARVPALGEAAVNLAVLHARAGRYTRAREALERDWRSDAVAASARQVRARLDAVDAP